MRKLFAVVLAAMLILPSCGAPSGDVDSRAETTSDLSAQAERNLEIENSLGSSEHLVGYSAAANGAVCDGGDVCYFVSQAYAHSLIVAYDKEMGTAAPLCKRENCSHDEINCSANIGTGYSGLTYHDGKLYWVESDTSGDTDLGMVVYCEDVESTVRTVVKTIISGNASGRINALFSDGKAIYTDAMYGGKDGAIHTVFGISDLNGGDDAVILDDESNEILGLTLPLNIDMRLINSAVYYTVTAAADPSDADSDVTVSVYSYDLNTGEFSTVCKLSSESGDIPKASSFKLLNGGELYFMTSETHEICRYNISEKSWQALFDFSEYGDTYGFPDGQIRNYSFVGDMCCAAVVNGGKTVIAAKDMNGNTVFETDISEFAESADGHSSVWISGGDDENVYCCLSFQDAGYTYQLDATVAVPIDGGSAKLMHQNKSGLGKDWSNK